MNNNHLQGFSRVKAQISQLLSMDLGLILPSQLKSLIAAAEGMG